MCNAQPVCHMSAQRPLTSGGRKYQCDPEQGEDSAGASENQEQSSLPAAPRQARNRWGALRYAELPRERQFQKEKAGLINALAGFEKINVWTRGNQ